MYFVGRHIWKTLVYIVIEEGYWKYSNKTSTPT